MLKIAQRRGIDVELPLQEQIRWCGNGNGSDTGLSSSQSILRHVSSGVGMPVMRGDMEVRAGQDRGDARRRNWLGPRKYPHLRG